MTVKEAILIIKDWLETLDYCGGCDFVTTNEEYYKVLVRAIETLIGYAEW